MLCSGLTSTASLSFSIFEDHHTPKKLSVVLYGSRPNMELVGIMLEYNRLEDA